MLDGIGVEEPRRGVGRDQSGKQAGKNDVAGCHSESFHEAAFLAGRTKTSRFHLYLLRAFNISEASDMLPASFRE